jgi:hypothetical protein
MQTNRVSFSALIVAGAMALLSVVEITASRAYKDLKRRPNRSDEDDVLVTRYERILKSVSLGVIALGAGLALFRFTHG